MQMQCLAARNDRNVSVTLYRHRHKSARRHKQTQDSARDYCLQTFGGTF